MESLPSLISQESDKEALPTVQEVTESPQASEIPQPSPSQSEPKQETLSWKEISMEVLAEMKDEHQKDNVHFHPSLEEISTDVHGSEASEPRHGAESVHEAFSKFSSQTVFPADRPISEMTSRILAQPDRRRKEQQSQSTPNIKTESPEQQTQETASDQKQSNASADAEPQRKVTSRTIDFSVLDKNKADLHRKLQKADPSEPSVKQLLIEMISLLKDQQSGTKASAMSITHNHYYSSK